jgi:hypothetical protein
MLRAAEQASPASGAPASPIAAPLSAPAVVVLNTMASVNTTVSRPSRPTAWKASSPSPSRALPSSAHPCGARSSAESASRPMSFAPRGGLA